MEGEEKKGKERARPTIPQHGGEDEEGMGGGLPSRRVESEEALLLLAFSSRAGSGWRKEEEGKGRVGPTAVAFSFVGRGRVRGQDTLLSRGKVQRELLEWDPAARRRSRSKRPSPTHSAHPPPARK